MSDDIAVWLRDRGTLMVNSGDQFTASDGERLLEGANTVERLTAALREVEGIADELTKVSMPSVRRIAKIRTIARRELGGEA